MIKGAKGRCEETIKSLIPEKLGIYSSEFLLAKALTIMNSEVICFLPDDHERKLEPEKDKNPFEVFKDMFPKEVKRTVIAEHEFNRTGVYTFKVSLSKKLWRKISVSHKHSLDDLHLTIQEAFDFDNDHLYAFFIGGTISTGKPIYCADAQDEGATAEETTIADLNLYKGEKLRYLFDFGDNWKFDVELINIDKDSVLPTKPEIVEAKGESPEQYNDWY